MKYKCHTCKLILTEEQLVNGNCPQCHSNYALKEMCPKDNLTCTHEIVNKLAYCPECGEPMCPICGCHDVSQISRITGYMADVSGYNEAKRQELRDRTRYTVE